VSSDAEMVVVGRVGAPYGVKGWVHVSAYTSPKENIAGYRPWYVQLGSGDGWRPLQVEALRDHRHGFVARFSGVDDRTAAEALRGGLIGVPASELPAPEEDEFYWRDLTGMTVEDSSGRSLGRVSGLLETGANDVLVIDTVDADRELLVPFHRRYVLSVERAARRIVVDWPEEA
jgi:16S rRNA processing protein RimM